MAERGRFSIDELKCIGWRIKSVRSLTGLNQEEFSSSGDIPYMTLKGWELGRALPRPDGLRLVLNNLEAHGIKVTPEWLIFGEGNGPVYGTKNVPVSAEDPGIEPIVKAFKTEQRRMGYNPIILKINDTSMSPRFRVGDLVGGIVLGVNELREKLSSEEIGNRAWLIPVANQEWVVRNIFFNAEKIFTKSLHGADIAEANIGFVGNIIWHYFPDAQT